MTKVRPVKRLDVQRSAHPATVSYSRGSSDSFRAMREKFLSGSGDASDLLAEGVNPRLIESWHRCMQHGLDTRSRIPLRNNTVDTESQLVRAANLAVSQRETMLQQSMCGLNLTDHRGVVVQQWVRDHVLNRWFDSQGIVPSASVDENAVGTSSGICLLNEQPIMVCGPEHFFDEYAAVTSAGVPVVHPVTRRIVGSLNLTSRYSDTSPVLLSWVMDIVRDIQQTLRASATGRERSLLDAYLLENRDTRHPLVALNDQTIITNATAARMVTAVDQALIWEHASRAIREGAQGPRPVALTNGTVVSMHCREVASGDELAGAVVRIQNLPVHRARKAQSSRVFSLHGLSGAGPRWRELCRAASLTDDSAVLITGERGTGRFVVAKAMAGPSVVVFNASELPAVGRVAWLDQVLAALVSTDTLNVIVRNCDAMDEATARSLADALLERTEPHPRLLATMNGIQEYARPSAFRDAFPMILTVPPLRERLEDLPCLLDALTQVAIRRMGRAPITIRWMPEAVQTLSRVQWPHNIGSLESVVARVLRNTSNAYIGVADLPADVVAGASRRALVGLQHVEANAITAALRAAGGNKNQAAEQLGIARSTLYRKIRALGIDLSTAAF